VNTNQGRRRKVGRKNRSSYLGLTILRRKEKGALFFFDLSKI
jgi:hypothetical protein